MTRQEILELLESLCQQARNRMLEWELSHVEFHMEDCSQSDGVHVVIIRHGQRLGSIHLWSSDFREAQPWMYEQYFMYLCVQIAIAEDMTQYIMEMRRRASQAFGSPPEHGGIWN